MVFFEACNLFHASSFSNNGGSESKRCVTRYYALLQLNTQYSDEDYVDDILMTIFN
jgi:hypothetical protein